MRKIVIGSVALAFGFASMSAFAVSAKESGIYLEGNVGYAKVKESVTNASKDNNTGFGWNVNAGYKFMPYFAAEVGFLGYPNENFGEAKGSQNYAIDVAAKGILPFSDSGFSLFGKLGSAWVHHRIEPKSGYTLTNSGTYKKFTALVGVGAAYAFTENFEVLLQGSATTKNGNVPSMWLGTLGVSYLF